MLFWAGGYDRVFRAWEQGCFATEQAGLGTTQLEPLNKRQKPPRQSLTAKYRCQFMSRVVPSHFDSIRDRHCLRARLLQTMKGPNFNCSEKHRHGNPVRHLCWLACLSYPQVPQHSSSLGAQTDPASTLPMSAASQCIRITPLMLLVSLLSYSQPTCHWPVNAAPVMPAWMTELTTEWCVSEPLSGWKIKEKKIPEEVKATLASVFNVRKRDPAPSVAFSGMGSLALRDIKEPGTTVWIEEWRPQIFTIYSIMLINMFSN